MSTSARTLALALLALAACERGPAPGHAYVDFRHSRQPGSAPVASWRGDQVTTAQLERRLKEMPPAQRERYQTLEARREYVESLARYELLVQEALARGLQNDPEVVEATRRALVARLMREQLQQAPASVSEQELAAAYARHQEDFVRPEQVRLTHLFLAAPRSEPARVAAARTRAGRLLAEARALPPKDFAAFGRLARAHSEEPRTQPLDGDTRLRSLEQLGRDFGPELAEAARALIPQGPGALALVQAEAGWHLVQLTAHQPALNLALEDVRERLTGRLVDEKRQRAWAGLLASLQEQAHLTVHAQALARVSVDPTAPELPPEGPAPGLVPPPTPTASEPVP